MDEYNGSDDGPSRGCLLGAALLCFFWAGVLVAVALWLGWV